MFKIAAIILLCVCSGIGFAQVTSEPGKQTDIAKLKETRLQLLQERIDLVQELVNMQRAAPVELARPTMDLLNAKIEYADLNDAKKDLYAKLLKQYDLLIEMAGVSKHEATSAKVQLDLLLLRAERVRIEIELGKLK